MKPILNNPYGYKICYREKGSPEYIERFLTYSYRQAVKVKQMYVKWPNMACIGNMTIKKPTWYIIPITKKEVKAGIWRQVPF